MVLGHSAIINAYHLIIAIEIKHLVWLFLNIFSKHYFVKTITIF